MLELSPVIQIMLIGLCAMLIMALLWCLQLIQKNGGIVDLGWAGAIGASGIFCAVTSQGEFWRRVTAATLIGVWSVRLTFYLFRRMQGHSEEKRYATLRKKWGESANKWLFLFFQIQAIAVLLFVLPLLVACWNGQHFSGWDVFGAVIWLFGFSGVAVADAQLKQFKQNEQNRGKTCRYGLWKYTRHPNYFFEWVLWWCWLPLSIGTAYWWIAVILPLLLLYTLVFKTGIPPTEAQAIVSRGDDYRNYQRTTSAFIPWWPKKDAEE